MERSPPPDKGLVRGHIDGSAERHVPHKARPSIVLRVPQYAGSETGFDASLRRSGALVDLAGDVRKASHSQHNVEEEPWRNTSR